MWYSLLADLVLAVHLAYVGYVLLGLVLILVGVRLGWRWVRNPWFRVTHLAAILVVVLELAFQTNCPLTVWEASLRTLAGQPASEGTFVSRLMHYMLFVAVPGWMAPLIYVGCALLIGAAFILAPPRWRREKQST